MKTILMFGGRGWIGSLYAKSTQHRVVLANTRPENFDECYEEIRNVNPDTVFCCIGRTHGSGCNSIDYLEEPCRHEENLRDNYQGPITLATICSELRIHMVYIGTGCIYNYTDDKKIFTEDDLPNFAGSQYSKMKGQTDQAIRSFDVVLNARIRMPISFEAHPRNFIDKLIAYPHICSIPNSMTVLESCFTTWDRMIEEKTVGTFNFTNPGTIDHDTILHIYKEWVDPSHTWKLITYPEQRRLLKSDRSNNELDSSKWMRYACERGIGVFPITKQVRFVLLHRALQREKQDALGNVRVLPSNLEPVASLNQSHSDDH